MQIAQREFRAVLDWYMSSDPFPTDSDTHAVVTEWLTNLAKAGGWGSLTEAYHRVPRSEATQSSSTPPASKDVTEKLAEALSELVERDEPVIADDSARIRFASNSQAWFVFTKARQALTDWRSARETPTPHERELEEVMKERDHAQDVLQDVHIVLGGDGEWKGRLPPQEPPDSGDLHLDVPALARERMAELACWHEQCTGKHGSQMPCVASVKAAGDCQHDLLRPDTTIEVIDPWKAKCKVCITFFDLPGRPAQKTAADDTVPSPRYESRFISSGPGLPPANFRITDTLSDARIATCFVEENAALVTAALNAYVSAEVQSGWEKSAAQFCSGMEYYRGLVDQIGEMLGEAAHICDDGSRSEDILRAKVPELVKARLAVAGPWIPICERVPEPEVLVLCWDGYKTFVEWFGSKPDAGRGVTHWIPYENPPGSPTNMHDGRRATKRICVCGEPNTQGVQHRTDGPCYVLDDVRAAEVPR